MAGLRRRWVGASWPPLGLCTRLMAPGGVPRVPCPSVWPLCPMVSPIVRVPSHPCLLSVHPPMCMPLPPALYPRGCVCPEAARVPAGVHVSGHCAACPLVPSPGGSTAETPGARPRACPASHRPFWGISLCSRCAGLPGMGLTFPAARAVLCSAPGAGTALVPLPCSVCCCTLLAQHQDPLQAFFFSPLPFPFN